MANRTSEINIILYFPDSENGRSDLEKRVASVHADAVLNCIKKLECPSKHKNALLDSIITDAKRKQNVLFKRTLTSN